MIDDVIDDNDQVIGRLLHLMNDDMVRAYWVPFVSLAVNGSALLPLDYIGPFANAEQAVAAIVARRTSQEDHRP